MKQGEDRQRGGWREEARGGGLTCVQNRVPLPLDVGRRQADAAALGQVSAVAVAAVGQVHGRDGPGAPDGLQARRRGAAHHQAAEREVPQRQAGARLGPRGGGGTGAAGAEDVAGGQGGLGDHVALVLQQAALGVAAGPAVGLERRRGPRRGVRAAGGRGAGPEEDEAAARAFLAFFRFSQLEG